MQILNASIVKKLAQESGFVACGISEAEIPVYFQEKYKLWIQNNYNSGMSYLGQNMDVRFQPDKLVQNAKSVISLLSAYYPDKHPQFKDFTISKYAYGLDYHNIIKNRGEEFYKKLKNVYQDLEARFFVDSVPISERYFAAKSGLGFIGKNACLINPQYGSYVFISELIVNLTVENYDNEISLSCGNCNLCEKICPTNALNNRILDSNRCISYHSIESKSVIPEIISKKISNQLFGCDVCQDVCPFNKNVKQNHDEAFKLSKEIENLKIEDLYEMSNREFLKRYKKTALKRAGRNKLISNYEIIRKNKLMTCL